MILLGLIAYPAHCVPKDRQAVHSNAVSLSYSDVVAICSNHRASCSSDRPLRAGFQPGTSPYGRTV